jgi:hypothetical protein
MKRETVMQRLGSLAGLATVITLAGAAAVSAQPPVPAKPPAEAITRPPVKVEGPSPQGYSVVLVLGDIQATSATDGNVPAAARKALADMKDFLPYKSYRLLDAQWILGSQRTVSRLRGPNDQEYELTLRGVVIAGGKLSVNFRLAEPGALLAVKPSPDVDSRAGRRAELENALRGAEAEAARARAASGEKRAETVAAANEKVAAIVRELQQEKGAREAALKEVAVRAAHAVIDTSFAMDVGETVVVGTSRVAGDKALIALLTAVAHAGK